MNKFYKSLPNPVKFFLFTELIMGLGMGVWFLNLNYFMIDRGYTPAVIGWLGAFGSLVTAVFSVLAGSLSDRKGYRWTMLVGCLLKAAGMLLTIFAPNLFFMAFARFVNGFGDALAITCAYPYIISLVDEERKNFVYSLLFSMSLFAMFGGNLAGGYLFSRLGLSNLHLTTLIIGTGLIGAGAIFRGFLPGNQNSGVKEKLKLFLPKEKFMVTYFIFNFTGYAEYFMASSMLNLICRDIVGIPEASVGLVLGLSVLVSSVSTLIAPFLTERYGRPRVSLITLTLLAVSFALMTRVGGLGFAGLAILMMLLNNMMVGVIDAPMLKRIPAADQGGFSGVKLLINSLATSAGIATAGIFIGMPQGRILLYGMASLLMLAQIGLYNWGFRNELEEGEASVRRGTDEVELKMG